MLPKADLIINAGAVYTADAAGSWTDAVAVAGGRIVAKGAPACKDLITRDTRVIEAPDGLLLPGFQDAHIHAPFAGLNRLHVDLTGLDGVDAYLASIAQYCRDNPDQEWIIGGGWSLDSVPNGLAAKELLDRVCPDRPVFLFGSDVHQAWVNSKALAIAGMDRDTPDGPNGRIERDPQTGELIGTLQEGAAYDFNANHVPLPTTATWRRAILNAQDHLWSLGITGWAGCLGDPGHRHRLP